MKFKVSLLISAFFIVAACTHNRFPEKISERISEEKSPDFVLGRTSKPLLDSLNLVVSRYKNRDEKFNLKDFAESWEGFKNETVFQSLAENEFLNWIEVTGLLFELTGDVTYSEEMERINTLSKRLNFQKAENDIESFVLTKMVDNIYVNLFEPVEIQFHHSMGGEVTFRQDTDSLSFGSVNIHFGMTEIRYIELYIRIPSWANETTVTVKKVKYVARPGTYCKIAKKWKEGDLVEIKFPINDLPDQL